MDHTSFAITAVHEGTRLYLFIVFPADPDRKKQMDIAGVKGRSKRAKADTYGRLVHPSASHFGHNVKHKGF